jgi:asparagine synthase (glutamine-hydrolysing)
LGLAHQDVILDSATYQADFDELVRYCDEPVGDPAAMPQWSLYRQARQCGYKVLLSGIGGDEVFFGYPGDNVIGERSRTLNAAEFKQWTGWNQSVVYRETLRQLDSLSNGALRAALKDVDEPLYAFRDSAPQGPDAMASILFGTYLVHNGCYLADRLGMGCSMEVRVPFLDHILVQSVFDLPLSRRFDVRKSKVLLRRLLRGLVPDAVLSAPKRAFEPPGIYLNILVSRYASEILDGALIRWGWVRRDKMEQLCARHNILPSLRWHRVRRSLGIPRASWLLFKVLAFERWYAELPRQPRDL